jgi:hypothetical protein
MGNRNSGQQGETLSDRARQVADRIERLGTEVVSSFEHVDAKKRIAKLQSIQNEIVISLAPVVSWLERRRPADTVLVVKRRLFMVLDEAVACAGMDIPHYAGGKVSEIKGNLIIPGARRTGEMHVMAVNLADFLRDWANDIEIEVGKDSVPFDGDDWEALEPLIRRLLKNVHGKRKINLEDLCPLVWEKSYSKVTSSALSTALSKANTFLRKRQSPLTLRKSPTEPFVLFE